MKLTSCFQQASRKRKTPYRDLVNGGGYPSFHPAAAFPGATAAPHEFMYAAAYNPPTAAFPGLDHMDLYAATRNSAGAYAGSLDNSHYMMRSSNHNGYYAGYDPYAASPALYAHQQNAASLSSNSYAGYSAVDFLCAGAAGGAPTGVAATPTGSAVAVAHEATAAAATAHKYSDSSGATAGSGYGTGTGSSGGCLYNRYGVGSVQSGASNACSNYGNGSGQYSSFVSRMDSEPFPGLAVNSGFSHSPVYSPPKEHKAELSESW